MTDELQRRLDDLETKYAYQEETLRMLNEVITAQQGQIERLSLICRQLVERVRSGEGGGAQKASSSEEVPPHY